MTEQQTEQTTNESRSVAEMSSEEIQAEIARVDAELAQAPSGPSPTSRPAATRNPGSSGGETLAREAQAARRDLIRQYEALDNDERFTEEARSEAMWSAFDKAKPLIEEKARAARDTLLKDAERLELSSIPFPGGQSLRTNNVELLALSQGERARISERINYVPPHIQRMKAAGKNVPPSAEAKPAKVLAEEFARGLELGGPMGGAICRSAISLAEDRGIDTNALVDEHRKPWQRNHLENAQQARVQAQTVYSRTPLPSRKRPGGARSPEEARAGKGRTPYGTVKKGSSAIPQKRRKPHWK